MERADWLEGVSGPAPGTAAPLSDRGFQSKKFPDDRCVAEPAADGHSHGR